MTGLVVLLAAFQDPGPWNRPEEIEQLRTKTAYALPQGEVEVDLVGSFLRFEEDGLRLDESKILLEVEIGLTDWLMAEIEVPYIFLQPDPGPGTRGWGDLELELKAAVPGDWQGIELAVGIDVSFLTGDQDKGLGSPHTELGAFAALSRRWDWLAAHLQAGVEVARGARPEYRINLALDASPWGRDWSLMLALNGEIEPGETPSWSLVPGFEVRLDELQIGVGFPLGISREAADWGVIVDLEIEF